MQRKKEDNYNAASNVRLTKNLIWNKCYLFYEKMVSVLLKISYTNLYEAAADA